MSSLRLHFRDIVGLLHESGEGCYSEPNRRELEFDHYVPFLAMRCAFQPAWVVYVKATDRDYSVVTLRYTYMSLNIYRRFMGEQSQIDAIPDCAYKIFMYSQSKQIIYITTEERIRDNLMVLIVLCIANTVMTQILIKGEGPLYTGINILENTTT